MFPLQAALAAKYGPPPMVDALKDLRERLDLDADEAYGGIDVELNWNVAVSEWSPPSEPVVQPSDISEISVVPGGLKACLSSPVSHG